MWSKGHKILWWEPFSVSHHPVKFGGHRHCGSGDMMFLVVNEQDFTCLCLDHPLLFSSKALKNRMTKEKKEWQLQTFFRFT